MGWVIITAGPFVSFYMFCFFGAFLSRRDERVMMSSSSDTQCKLRTVL